MYHSYEINQQFDGINCTVLPRPCSTVRLLFDREYHLVCSSQCHSCECDPCPMSISIAATASDSFASYGLWVCVSESWTTFLRAKIARNRWWTFISFYLINTMARQPSARSRDYFKIHNSSANAPMHLKSGFVQFFAVVFACCQRFWWRRNGAHRHLSISNARKSTFPPSTLNRILFLPRPFIWSRICTHH